MDDRIEIALPDGAAVRVGAGFDAAGPAGARAMIAPPPRVRVLIWSEPVDFRRGMDSLAALVHARYPARRNVGRR
ncbi:hypothetical protein HL658_17615 [Azospirillum sp. RWY-5-1]|uniref:Uncharacterized protein n=1 Tax=Azospirillum oleiclasticum TaxID=2735135 RepID=A0ABX2THQ2_9PROT|nr:hypothetical protein [Azospirillum oleiclasticum]NYZ14373.1 hypothetical protein [Azospirillum oleiclasticum]NYZ23275.1 hypothetical protein [Azospirillum oleiclasticum]